MNIAGIGTAKRLIAKDGSPAPLEDFRNVIEVNLIGTYNVIRLAMAETVKLEPLEDGERGVIVCTASVAAFDGQVGQEAYSASKGGLVGMTLPLARDLAQYGVRVVTIAPGLFLTPLMASLPQAGAGLARREHPVPQAAGQTRRVRPALRQHRREHVAQRRSDPSRRRACAWRRADGRSAPGFQNMPRTTLHRVTSISATATPRASSSFRTSRAGWTRPR